MAELISGAVREDVTTLRDIERAQGQGFREQGLDGVAHYEPASLEALAAYADDGRAWVAVDAAGQPIGFVLVDMVDGGGHIEQVSVAPATRVEALAAVGSSKPRAGPCATRRPSIALIPSSEW